MSSAAPFADITAKLVAAALGYPIWYPNATFKPPTPPTPWLRLSVTSDVLAPVELGADIWRETGTAYVEVIVPAYSGSSTARAIAKSVANAFRGLTSPYPVVYMGASIGDGLVQPVNGAWWGLTVSLDWKYEDGPVDKYGVPLYDSDGNLMLDSDGNIMRGVP